VKKEPTWLDKQALLLLHEESAAEFGGPTGVRDEGMLDSALARPVNRFLYDKVHDLASLAAAYGYRLAKNHPFLDGNKRAGFLSVGLFLAMNGKRLNADPVDAVRRIVALAAGELTEPDLAAWIAANLDNIVSGGPSPGCR
jgi:death-on-curing protein